MKTGHAGLAYEPDKVFERDYRLTQTENSVRIEYDETVQRISTELDVSECCEGAPLHRIRKAVWDTGATSSVIAERAARRMGLKPVDMGVIITATGQVEVPIYFLDVRLSNQLTVRNLRVMGSPMEQRDVDFLVGMDIISKGKLVIDNAGGKTTVTFTMD